MNFLNIVNHFNETYQALDSEIHVSDFITYTVSVGVISLSPVNMILPFIDIQYIFTQYSTIRIYINVGIDYTILAK
jgi:outer membrane protein W